jgi:NAD(P)-dependent dehydrogenase (short-subunit alcohol dehydrogenase family)
VTMDFTGKHVVITGANRGIGLGVAEGFLKSGARVSIAGLEEETRQVASDLGKRFGTTVAGFVLDISDLAQVEGFANAVDAPDILINNAGLEYITPLNDPAPSVDDMFRNIMLINVVGTFSVCRKLVGRMPDGGRIVNTASMWGKTAVAEYSAYCASKHAIIGLTRSLAQELAPRNISVNAVCPGWVRTAASMRTLAHMAARSGRSETELLSEIVGAQALGGLMEPSDMADIYLFLASDAARNITGQAYTVDRGELMQ